MKPSNPHRASSYRCLLCVALILGINGHATAAGTTVNPAANEFAVVVIKAGDNLSTLMKSHAREAGWALHWELSEDYVLPDDLHLNGGSIVANVHQALDHFKARGALTNAVVAADSTRKVVKVSGATNGYQAAEHPSFAITPPAIFGRSAGQAAAKQSTTSQPIYAPVPRSSAALRLGGSGSRPSPIVEAPLESELSPLAATLTEPPTHLPSDLIQTVTKAETAPKRDVINADSGPMVSTAYAPLNTGRQAPTLNETSIKRPIATISVPSPSNAEKPKTKLESNTGINAIWTASHGSTLQKTVSDWAAIEHWAVSWNDNQPDLEIVGTIQIPGSLVDAITYLFGVYKVSGAKYEVELYKEQKLILVKKQ